MYSHSHRDSWNSHGIDGTSWDGVAPSKSGK